MRFETARGQRRRGMEQADNRLALSLAEASTVAGISRSRMYQLLADGTGPRSLRIGRRHLIRLAALNEWLADLEAEQNAGDVDGE